MRGTKTIRERARTIHGLGASALLLTSLVGCDLITKQGDEYNPEVCLAQVCPRLACDVFYEVDRSVLEACYGWDATTGTWAAGTPAPVANCKAGEDPCELRVPNGSVGAEPFCTWGQDGQAASLDDCSWQEPPLPDEGFAGELASACEIEVPQPTQTCAPESNVTFLQGGCGGSCPDSDSAARVAQPPAGATTLTLDRERSFVAFATPFQTVSVALSGTAVADLRTSRLLSARIAPARTRAGGADWDGWTLGLEAPVQMFRTGESFTIPLAQRSTIVGTGRRNGALSKVHAVATRALTGHLAPARGTFDLDFADQSAAGSLTIHLAGTMR